MTRADRMAPVQRVLGSTEKDRAKKLAAIRTECELAVQKLTDLTDYRSEYDKAFVVRAKSGHSVVALRDFQLFLARLDQAIAQQQQIVAQSRLAVDEAQIGWKGAAQRVRAVDSVVDRWQQEARQVSDRKEQKESDERAQRAGRASGRSGEQS
jgi:flagellar protein FliJ